MCSGTPRSTNSSASTSITCSAVIPRPTSNAKHSRVYSSTIAGQLQRPTVGGVIVDEIPRPHVVLMRRPATRTAVVAVAQTPLFPPFSRHFQALPPPKPIDPLAAGLPTLLPQQSPDPPIAISRVFSHQFQHPLYQRPLGRPQPRPITLRSTRLTEYPARTTFRYAKLFLRLADRLVSGVQDFLL